MLVCLVPSKHNEKITDNHVKSEVRTRSQKQSKTQNWITRVLHNSRGVSKCFSEHLLPRTRRGNLLELNMYLTSPDWPLYPIITCILLQRFLDNARFEIEKTMVAYFLHGQLLCRVSRCLISIRA